MTLIKRAGGMGVLMALAIGVAMPVTAAERDALIEGGRLCTQNFPIEERKNTIPTHLLAAISTTESGRWHSGLGMAVPWPWTINVEGKGYYFDTKAEAIAQTRKLLSTGHESIDVGCMQVNLKHHPKAFANLDQAFEPATNVAYAAKFLHDNYADLGDWIKATAAYHSRTSSLGQQYLAEIERSWNKIVTKVAAARAAQGINAPVAGAQPTLSAMAAPADTGRKMRPIKEAHNVKVIHIGESPETKTVRNEVMVIRPSAPVAATPVAPAAPVVAVSAPVSPVATVKLADAGQREVQPTTTQQTGNELKVLGGDSVRRVSLGSPATSSPTGPKFVFAN